MNLAASHRDIKRTSPASTSTHSSTPSLRPPPLPSLRVAKGTVEREQPDEDDEWKLRAAFAEARLRAAPRVAQPVKARAPITEEREWEALRARANATEEREWRALRARVCAAEEREWEELRARASGKGEERSLRTRAGAAAARARPELATGISTFEPAAPPCGPTRVVFWP